jgi:transcriptional regulator with XRE-family HTH domain
MTRPDPAGFAPDADRLRALIEGAQLAQAEVAAGIGVDARTMRRYLDGSVAYSYPVWFTVQAFVAAARAARVSPAKASEQASRELVTAARGIQRKLARLPTAAKERSRARRQLSVIATELRRREGA